MDCPTPRYRRHDDRSQKVMGFIFVGHVGSVRLRARPGGRAPTATAPPRRPQSPTAEEELRALTAARDSSSQRLLAAEDQMAQTQIGPRSGEPTWHDARTRREKRRTQDPAPRSATPANPVRRLPTRTSRNARHGGSGPERPANTNRQVVVGHADLRAPRHRATPAGKTKSALTIRRRRGVRARHSPRNRVSYTLRRPARLRSVNRCRPLPARP